jgi:hypothetical protein
VALETEGEKEFIIPNDFADVLISKHKDKWMGGMNEELDQMDSRGVYSYVERPKNKKVLPVKWHFDLKRNEDGDPVRFKARFVVKGYMQVEGLDFQETYAPVCRAETRRVLFAIAAQKGMKVHHLDVKTAFLYADLDEEVYVEQPPGFESGDKVLKLHKALYGLKQAPRAWHTKLVEELTAVGFKANAADPGLFVHITATGSPVYLPAYVDDILLVSSNDSAVEVIMSILKAVFDLHDLGEASHFLGIKVERNWDKGTIKLSHPAKIDDLMESFGMVGCKPRIVPMDASFVMTEKEQDGDEGSGVLLEKGHRYLELIGSLMYVANNFRPDIAHAVGLLARYRAAPTTSHWEAAKRILAYLGSTRDMGLVYGGVGSFGLHAYVDADYAGCLDSRKSTTGYVFLLYGGAVSWCSRKQQSVASSTVEYEYMAFHACAKVAVWLRGLVKELGLGFNPVVIFGDNQGCIANVKNPITSRYTKHIDVAYHAVRELASLKKIVPCYVPTDENVADTFTKPLAKVKFRRFREGMGIL